jgi:3-hydroxyacyl-[acyl-carrier-protein] dehydratase
MRIEHFQLIDRIIELNLSDLTIRAEAVVPTTSSIFEGHFPGHPIMPGVLLIEAMAQTSGWLAFARTKFDKMPFLAAIKEAKLRTFVRPGQVLSLTSKLVHEGSGFMVADAMIMAGDKPVCDAVITLRLMPFPAPQLRSTMKELAQRLELPMETLAKG